MTKLQKAFAASYVYLEAMSRFLQENDPTKLKGKGNGNTFIRWLIPAEEYMIGINEKPSMIKKKEILPRLIQLLPKLQSELSYLYGPNWPNVERKLLVIHPLAKNTR